MNTIWYDLAAYCVRCDSLINYSFGGTQLGVDVRNFVGYWKFGIEQGGGTGGAGVGVLVEVLYQA